MGESTVTKNSREGVFIYNKAVQNCVHHILGVSIKKMHPSV